MIRLWKFTKEINDNNCKSSKELNDSLRLESKKIDIMKEDGSICSYAIQLETAISGHDGWIYGVHWKPKISHGIFLERIVVVAYALLYYTYLIALKYCRQTNGVTFSIHG